MRRLLPIAALLALVVGTIAGVAWANAEPANEPAAKRAPLAVPPTAPAPDRAQPGTFGYRPSADIAATISGAPAAPAPSAAAGASATVTVTATVLPAVTLQLDASGELDSIVTNTPDRDARSVLFIARGIDGAAVSITDEVWADARAALATATAGSGTIWSR